jgi:hypothetical protein
MLVETVSANPRESRRFEAIDQNRLVASSLESRGHGCSFLAAHTAIGIAPDYDSRGRLGCHGLSHLSIPME